MSARQSGRYWVKMDGVWVIGFWDGHCWEDDDHFGLQDFDYDTIGSRLINPDGNPS